MTSKNSLWRRIPVQNPLHPDYPTLSGPGSRCWLLIERGDAETCDKYPGGEEQLVVVVNDPVTFARWHLGDVAWAEALRAGAIELHGSATLSRALPTWHRDHQHGPRPLHSAHPTEPAPTPAAPLA